MVHLWCVSFFCSRPEQEPVRRAASAPYVHPQIIQSGSHGQPAAQNGIRQDLAFARSPSSSQAVGPARSWEKPPLDRQQQVAPALGGTPRADNKRPPPLLEKPRRRLPRTPGTQLTIRPTELLAARFRSSRVRNPTAQLMDLLRSCSLAQRGPSRRTVPPPTASKRHWLGAQVCGLAASCRPAQTR